MRQITHSKYLETNKAKYYSPYFHDKWTNQDKKSFSIRNSSSRDERVQTNKLYRCITLIIHIIFTSVQYYYNEY